MNEEKVIEMLLKHDKDIEYIKENMSTKEDIRGLSGTLDKLVKRPVNGSFINKL